MLKSFKINIGDLEGEPTIDHLEAALASFRDVALGLQREEGGPS